RVYARAGERLYALNTPDGSIAWVFDADADLNVGAILVPGGRILLADDAGALYLLDASLDYAASAWPVAEYGNRRHTGKTGDVLPLTITTIKILQPDGVDDAADAVYTITWADVDPDDNAVISLYYDTDDNGENGVLIAENIPGDDETDQYEWNTSNVPEGDYYIYAIIDDGAGNRVVDYGEGAATIRHNRPPAAIDDAVFTDEDTPVVIDVLANDHDPDAGDVLTIKVVTGSAHGRVTRIARDITYEPDKDFYGVGVVEYVVRDDKGGEDAAAATITVRPVNDPPLAGDDRYTIRQGESLTVTGPGVLENDADVENDPLEAILDGDVANGDLTLNSDGSFTYTHHGGGGDSFTYKANDGKLDGAAATVHITALPPEATVVFSSDAYTVSEGAGKAAIRVNLSNAAANPITVDFGAGDGAAKAGRDYTAISKKVKFAPGETTKSLEIAILTDALDEGDETIRLTLSHPVNAVTGDPGVAVLTIIDEPPPASLIHVEPAGACGGKSPCRSTIHEAIQGSAEKATIKLARGDYHEKLVIDAPKTLNLQGGYDASFQENADFSTINGLEIGKGAITVDRVIIKPTPESEKDMEKK
ncbi:MAG: tandem-95 repeat protein, partial [Desulfobacterales bacterium]|nr:tandem-95 repeat protein [Desulfobacterales bacterium]